MSDRQHGTYVKYKLDGCRCYPCGFADSQYRDRRRRAIAYGTWQPYVDAEPAREHVRTLQEFGLGWKRIAHLAGVPNSTMWKLLYGARQRGMAPSKRIRPETAQKILAVEPRLDLLGTRIPVDATGTRRRLQALTAGGWPQAQLAARLGIHPSNYCTMLARPQVNIGTARASAALYDELWNADPANHGVHPQGISRARNYAKNHGWAPVGAWDDDTIDDPQTFPDWTGQCGTPTGYNTHYRRRIPTCEPCREAMNVYNQQLRAARKEVAA